MAFLRFTRDKRGYEQFALVEPVTNRRGKTRTRVLYWYRTPPNIKVGREPFDDGIRRALEAQNPDIAFDWKTIIETPVPSADAEKWRERRRVEKAEKVARQQVAAARAAERAADEPEDTDAPDEGARADTPAAPRPTYHITADQIRKKRRRRRGRGSRDGIADATSTSTSTASAQSIDVAAAPADVNPPAIDDGAALIDGATKQVPPAIDSPSAHGAPTVEHGSSAQDSQPTQANAASHTDAASHSDTTSDAAASSHAEAPPHAAGAAEPPGD